MGVTASSACHACFPLFALRRARGSELVAADAGAAEMIVRPDVEARVLPKEEVGQLGRSLPSPPTSSFLAEPLPSGAVAPCTADPPSRKLASAPCVRKDVAPTDDSSSGGDVEPPTRSRSLRPGAFSAAELLEFQQMYSASVIARTR
eukprot:TRINITY_DN39500_c0_g1_i1.p2 TRINITY_DN39500_c0_g1~~TRINITY_DN39500_c0_g1_i1.p2  ORF type:complete len:147 (+),score=25.52 TRINITY_DN39500_c0_g1_i1:50-490(+)